MQVISQQLDRVKKVKSHETVSISLEKGPFEVNRSKLLFIQSVGNYLVFNLSGTNGQIKKLTKRGRIHQAEKDMEVYPEFFRCHRAFIVNLKQIKQMKGASKNARLVVGHGLDEIPVSRQQFSALKKQLDKIIAPVISNSSLFWGIISLIDGKLTILTIDLYWQSKRQPSKFLPWLDACY